MTDDELDALRRLRPDDVLSDEAVDAAVLARQRGEFAAMIEPSRAAKASSHRRFTRGSPMRTSEPHSITSPACSDSPNFVRHEWSTQRAHWHGFGWEQESS
jgi:hypothetical protein